MAAALPVPTHGIDDETAIVVAHVVVDVFTEGRWRRFSPTAFR